MNTLDHTDLVVVGDEAMLAHINTMFEAEQIGHLPLGTLAETHGHLLYWQFKNTYKKILIHDAQSQTNNLCRGEKRKNTKMTIQSRMWTSTRDPAIVSISNLLKRRSLKLTVQWKYGYNSNNLSTQDLIITLLLGRTDNVAYAINPNFPFSTATFFFLFSFVFPHNAIMTNPSWKMAEM